MAQIPSLFLSLATAIIVTRVTTSESMTEQAVTQVAEEREKTPAQVILRWAVQRGTSIIPKSTDPGRMRENLAITDFFLTERQMNAITALNANRRFNDPGLFCEQAFGRFHPIYD